VQLWEQSAWHCGSVALECLLIGLATQLSWAGSA